MHRHGFYMDIFYCTGSYDVIKVWIGVGHCMDVGSSVTCLYRQETMATNQDRLMSQTKADVHKQEIIYLDFGLIVAPIINM